MLYSCDYKFAGAQYSWLNCIFTITPAQVLGVRWRPRIEWLQRSPQYSGADRADWPTVRHRSGCGARSSAPLTRRLQLLPPSTSRGSTHWASIVFPCIRSHTTNIIITVYIFRTFKHSGTSSVLCARTGGRFIHVVWPLPSDRSLQFWHWLQTAVHWQPGGARAHVCPYEQVTTTTDRLQ